MDIPIVDMQEQKQKSPYDIYRIRSVADAISFAQNAIGYDRDGDITICAIDSEKKPAYIQTAEKKALWDHQFLVDICKNAVLSDAVGMITFCIQKDRLTEIDIRDIEWVYELSRLGYGLGIKFIDHIFLDGIYCLSFMDSNMLPSIDLLMRMEGNPFFIESPPNLEPSLSIRPIT